MGNTCAASKMLLSTFLIAVIALHFGACRSALAHNHKAWDGNDFDHEEAHLSFVTPLRHKRDIHSRPFHIIQVHLPERNVTLVAHVTKAHHIVADDLSVVVRHESTTVKSVHNRESHCHYSGQLSSDSESQVSLSMCGDDDDEPQFRGMISSNNQVFIVEPNPNGTQKKIEYDKTVYVEKVYRPKNKTEIRSDVIRVSPEELVHEDAGNEDRSEQPGPKAYVEDENEEEEEASLINTFASSKKSSSRKKGRQRTEGSRQRANGRVTVEIAVFADPELYRRIEEHYPTDTDRKVKDYCLAVVNNMNLVYQQRTLGTEISIVLVHLEIMTTSPRNLRISKQARDYIHSFCSSYQSNIGGRNNRWDHAVMITGLDLQDKHDHGLTGLAYFATMCFKKHSCSIIEGGNFGAGLVLAHELGHSLGMEHDGTGPNKKCHNDRYIMSPTTGGGKTSWSTCSSDNIRGFVVNGNPEVSRASPECLYRSSGKTIKYCSGKPPGQIYDAYEQCKLIDAKSKPYTEVSICSDVCRLLCCFVPVGATRMRIFPGSPALEGTKCNKIGKPLAHCKNGVCQVS